MRRESNPNRGDKRDYIPNDEIDREEKADIRQQKKGSTFTVLLGGLLDSGVMKGGGGETLYGTPQTSASSGGGELTQEEKKAAEEEARLAREEAKQKKQSEDEARKAEEEAARKAEEEEAEKAREEEAKKKAEEEAQEREKAKEEEEARKKASRRCFPAISSWQRAAQGIIRKKRSQASLTGRSCLPSMRFTPERGGYSPAKSSEDILRAKAGTMERFLRRNLTPTRMSALMNMKKPTSIFL